MAENKFIKHLKGTETAGSVLEIKNQATPATFGNMPSGTSNPNTAYADARGDATGVLKGTDNWKLDGSTLTLATQVYGDGRDFTDTYTASGSSLWVNATYTFTSAKIFGANTKWVLKLCGANLLSAVADTIDFSLIIKFGSTPLVTKTFSVAEQANNFCQQFVIDFNEWTQNVLKTTSGDTLTIQLLCGDSTASATIYNGMTTLTALQRRVDGDVVASDTSTFDDLEQGLDNKVSKTGDTMSGALTFTNATGAGGIFGYPNGVVFFYMNGDTRTQLATLSDEAFMPYITDTISLGDANHRWLSATIKTVYTPTLNNGYDIAVPVTNSADTLALKSELDGKVNDTGDTLTGLYKHQYGSRTRYMAANSTTKYADVLMNSDEFEILFHTSNSVYDSLYGRATNGYVTLYPGTDNQAWLGLGSRRWNRIFVTQLCPDATNILTLPNETGVLATKANVDLAANSGRMITDQGVWYAKMDALGTIPSSAEVEGRNYADFTQVDGNNDPIIVIYTYTSGAWVQTETITPPSAYDGYVPITSKIWDIPEQTGQQGGRILWNHTSKDFTPYPMIVSFDGANITNGAFSGGTITSSTFDGSATLSGTSTVTMPVSPGSTQIVNKDYVDTALAGVQFNMPLSVDVTFDSSDINAPTITSDGRIIPNITASHEIIPGMLALDQCEIVLAFEGQHAGAVILWARPGDNTNSFELTLSSGNLLKLNGVNGVTTIDPAQKYYAKITRVGTTCTLSLSTDGTVFTTECTTTISSLLTTKYYIQTSVGATLYCAECYIVNNGIKIWQGVGSPGLHQRVETGHEVIEFQAPTALNDYAWYRKYADGWVEQGGVITVNRQNANSTQTTTVDLPVTMADTNYYVAPLTFITDGGNTTGLRNHANDRTTTQLKIKTYSTTGISNNYTAAWEVKGMMAQS